jgi:hypothetical protein
MSNNKDIYILGSPFGVQLRAHRSVLIGILGMWALMSAIAAGVLRIPARLAAGVGLAATAVHWLSTLTHQGGHALAAHQTGHPMKGTTLWWVMSRSVYPRNEPELPPEIHIQRALGGPIANTALGILFGLLVAVLPRRTPAWWLALLGLLENLFVFGAQVIVPLPFNDGGTIFKNLQAIRERERY